MKVTEKIAKRLFGSRKLRLLWKVDVANEIVKRLYRSEKLKALYPDRKECLRHIFEKQVFGLAPTKIIYNIATNFILGFADDVAIERHNFKQLDAVPYAKEGTLEAKLDEIYGAE